MSPKVSQEFVEAMLKENRELRYALKQILQCRNIAQAKDLAKLALMQPMDAR